jgi:hypothetical protein
VATGILPVATTEGKGKEEEGGGEKEEGRRLKAKDNET